MGAGTWAAGLTCAPTAPASLSVKMAPGILGTMTVVEQNAFGAVLPADTTDPLMKMGVNTAAGTLTFVAPVTAGQSQNFLIQAQMQETDGSSTALNFYNAANPAVPIVTTENTQRTQRVVFQVKAGTPASTGSQTTPGADAGWSPLYVIMLANGQTQITTASIAQSSSAPFLLYSLAQSDAVLVSTITNAGITLNPTNTGQLTAAINAIIVSAFTNNQVLSASGYQKLPGGLILQWGIISSLSAAGSVTISYPIVFPNAVLTAGGLSGGTAAGVPGVNTQILSVSQIKFWNQSNSLTSQAGLYFAIGW